MNTVQHEILFIDANILDKESLISEISPNVHVVVLDDKTDVLTQLADVLDHYQNLDAIHIISHGAEGQLTFTNGVLTNTNINDYAAQLKRIGSALSATGDILLYGCDVAKGDDGIAFINTLADLTDADVAASDDWTGSRLLGGNKTLEVANGFVETVPINLSYKVLLGNAVTSSTLLFPGHTMGEFRNDYAFAVIKSDGSVVTWGDLTFGGDSSSVATALNGSVDVVQVFSASGSFAALRADGSVITWGGNGGDSSAVADQLNGTIDVVQVFSNGYAFAALRADGSVITWGDANYGGDSTAVASQLNGTVGIVKVFSSDYAFAALRADGSVVTWGDSDWGGNSSTVASQLNGTVDVVQVFSTAATFAALREDGAVITWGDADWGGNSRAIASQLSGTVDVTRVFSTQSAFAALRVDTSVVTWAATGQFNNTVDVVQVFSNGYAFAALRSDGSVVTWGDSDWGGNSSAVASQLNGTIDVVQIFSNGYAFAALRSDGSVITWGDANYGGDSSTVATALSGMVDVLQVFSTDYAFAALRVDGSVVTWGNSASGGDCSTVTSQLDGTNDVVRVFATQSAFAAWRADGSVITWGDSLRGGDSSAVASQLTSGVCTLSDIEDNTNLVFNKSNYAPTGKATAALAQTQVNKIYLLYADDLLKGFSDVDGDTLSVVNLTASTGSLTNNNNGSWTYTPQTNYSGIISLSYGVTDGKSTSLSATQSFTIIQNQVSPTGSVNISGIPQQNQILVASNTLADANGLGPISYTWLRDGIAILNATQSSYMVTQADVGKKITVNASYTDLLGTLENVASTSVTAVGPVNHLPTGVVTIIGTAFKGQILTATNNLTDADGLSSINYTWLKNEITIPNATQSTYKLTQADTGQNISVKVSYVDLQNTTESVTSNRILIASNQAPTGAATIKGLSTWGTTLSVTNTIKDADGLGKFSYTWQSDKGILSTNTTYTLANSDTGGEVWVVISYTDKKGNLEEVKSSVVGVTVSNKPSAVNDILTGTDSADKLNGLAGNDTLIGGLGKDTLTGGIGADVFKFNSTSDSSALPKQADTLTDFKHAQGDKIDLSAIDANLVLEGDQAFTFLINTTAFGIDATGQLRFDAKTNTLYGSTNADAVPEFAIILSGVKDLTADDFIL